jgi:hypothetical protein
MTYTNNTYNVTFRVSFDTNNDGTYEEIYTSGTYINASSLALPFEAQAMVHNSTPSITFKVEVFESSNITTQLVSGSGPLHTVENSLNSTGAWAYNNINASSSPDAYYIFYEYSVSPVYQVSLLDTQPTRWNGTTNTFDVLPLIWNIVAVAAVGIVVIALIIIWRGRQRSPPEP